MKVQKPLHIPFRLRKLSWTRPILLATVLAILLIGLVWQWTKQIPIVRLLPTLPKPTRKAEKTPQLTESIIIKGKSSSWEIKYPSRWQISPQSDTQNTGVEKIIDTKLITNYRVGQADKSGIPNDAVRITLTITAGGNGRTIDSLLDCGGKTMTCEIGSINEHPFKKSTAVLNVGTMTIAAAGVSGDDLFRAVATIYPGPNQEINKNTVEQVIQSIVPSP